MTLSIRYWKQLALDTLRQSHPRSFPSISRPALALDACRRNSSHVQESFPCRIWNWTIYLQLLAVFFPHELSIVLKTRTISYLQFFFFNCLAFFLHAGGKWSLVQREGRDAHCLQVVQVLQNRSMTMAPKHIQYPQVGLGLMSKLVRTCGNLFADMIAGVRRSKQHHACARTSHRYVSFSA